MLRTNTASTRQGKASSTTRALSNAGRNIVSQDSEKRKNFVKDNKSVEQAKRPTKSVDAPKSKNYGKVPEYLNKFKEEKQEQQRLKDYEKEQAKLPPGMRLMPDEERIETLNDLKAAKRDTEI